MVICIRWHFDQGSALQFIREDVEGLLGRWCWRGWGLERVCLKNFLGNRLTILVLDTGIHTLYLFRRCIRTLGMYVPACRDYSRLFWD
jgi:hypothetical protein